MRIGDVVVGETYVASIPQRLPAAMRDQPFTTPQQWQARMQLHLLRGRRFHATVTGYGETDGTVVVTQELEANRVALRLTAEQAAALDLAEGQEYEIQGIVTDQDGHTVSFPAHVTHTVPARWLRPLGEHQELHPESEQLHRAEVCRDADG